MIHPHHLQVIKYAFIKKQVEKKYIIQNGPMLGELLPSTSFMNIIKKSTGRSRGIYSLSTNVLEQQKIIAQLVLCDASRARSGIRGTDWKLVTPEVRDAFKRIVCNILTCSTTVRHNNKLFPVRVL